MIRVFHGLPAMSEPVRPSLSEGRDPGYKVHSTSRGAHGLRHAYPQERMRGLVRHAEHGLALAIVSMRWATSGPGSRPPVCDSRIPLAAAHAVHANDQP